MKPAIVTLVALLLVVGSSGAQAPILPLCESERAQLRWLVQKYGSERTTLEFALATSEAHRQAAEARLKALEEALKSAPKGQK